MVNPIKTSATFYRAPALSRTVVKEHRMAVIPEDRKRCMRVDYTNWKGERRSRVIKPIELEWGSTQWHPIHQWLLRAKDMEDGKVKHFAMDGFHSMKAEKR
jgi:hypothetical protein